MSYFTKHELECKCGCGKEDMSEEFMLKLNALRAAYGKPMYLSSGYRCTSYDDSVSKKGRGAHTTGRAVDVLVYGKDAYNLLSLALFMGFTGIGVSQNGAHNTRFIHLDDLGMNYGNRPWAWSY